MIVLAVQCNDCTRYMHAPLTSLPVLDLNATLPDCS